MDRIISDSHIHFSAPDRLEEFRSYLTRLGIGRAGIVSLPDRRLINFNPEAFAAKLAEPECCYVFGGLDYRDRFFPGTGPETPPLAAQAERLTALGADGIKMWIGKPTFQREVGLSLDAAEFSELFEVAASTSLPVVVHVADPEIFWTRLQEGGRWVLGGGAGAPGPLASFGELQRQAEVVLQRHSKTRFIFPHLLFRTGNLASFGDFMRRYPNALLDLSPGLYFFADLHRARSAAIRFLSEFRERILFGSDGMWFDEGHPYLPRVSLDENLARTEMLLTFLQTDRELPNPFEWSRGETPTVRGLALDSTTLEFLLQRNFERLLGRRPRPARSDLIADYTAEIAELRRSIAAAEGTP